MEKEGWNQVIVCALCHSGGIFLFHNSASQAGEKVLIGNQEDKDY